MKKIIINSFEIEKLKGLNNVTISFSKPLTAIMGTNGSGKTTILHALACCFTPETEWGQNWWFSYFFTPNPNASWTNSKFTLNFISEDKLISRTYQKQIDRWAPRYTNRPIRDTFYIGIDSCLPEIEISSSTSRIFYSTSMLSDKISKKIIHDASVILNKDYESLTSNLTATSRELIGVTTKSSLIYSSLSMGSGEQRIIKILRVAYTAPAYSMILIDEIDLLLHSSALYKLIEHLFAIALDRHLQIIFTTHSLLMNNLKKYVDIRFLENTPSKTLIYDDMSFDTMNLLSTDVKRPIKIYVEDSLSLIIIKTIALTLNIKGKVQIIKYGAIENAFTLAAGLILKQENISNTLIVLDGDRYQTEGDKLKQIQKSLSGTECDIDEKQKAALQLITQYNLPLPTYSPEYNLYKLLCKIPVQDADNEIIRAAHRIHAVNDSHDWIDQITQSIDDSSDIVTHEIIKLVQTLSEWNSYISPITTWLSSREKL